MIRRIGAFFGAALAAYILGALVSTQMILAEVAALGLPVPAGVRASATLHDLAGMAATYLPLVALSLLLGFAAAAFMLRFLPAWRTLGYLLAGAGALLALHLILYATLGMHPVPATRTALGLAAQVAAGALGGYVFAWLGGRLQALGGPLGNL